MAKQTRKYADWELSRLQSELEFLNYECGRIGRGHAEQAEAKREAIKAELDHRNTEKRAWFQSGVVFKSGTPVRWKLQKNGYLKNLNTKNVSGKVIAIDDKGFSYQSLLLGAIRIDFNKCEFENQPEAAQV